ncbi:MAG: 4-alpha-glucanotransferase [Actinomycetes bacterium]
MAAPDRNPPADRWGVAPGWWATDGSWRQADPSAVGTVRAAMGADEHPEGPPAGPVRFVAAGHGRPLDRPGLLRLEDGTDLEVTGHLPPDLPLGAHLLEDGAGTTTVFVVPARAPQPSRSWGWAAQLYATRSTASWGHGDLVDLAELARWAQGQGASWLAHEPVGALRPPGPAGGRPADSPYSPSSRRFPSPLYLRVEDVPGAELAPDAVVAAARAGRALNAERGIDRCAVWTLKQTALEAVWRQVGPAWEPPDDPDLARHATFCALAEAHDGGWRTWPAGLRHPGSTEVATFRDARGDRVRFWAWCTASTTAQLAAAGAAGAGLVGDLAVGFDPDGSDAWCDQDLLATGCRVGAPPDDFAPDGQDWGLPPYVPWRLRAAGYGPWLATLRAQLAHSAALRIDHVMGLFRLFWVPDGSSPAQGTYVSQFGTELLDLAVMEAVRAGAVLVGEDLGTVEPSVRSALGARGVLGYRIGWFEDAPPSEWPSGSLAATTTHDLPTVAGLWTGADARRRSEAGLPPDPAGDELLRHRLRVLTGSPDDRPTEQVVLAAEEAVAHSPSLVALATLEDACAVEERPNQPGTVDELPNWRLALPVRVEELDATAAPAIAWAMRDADR